MLPQGYLHSLSICHGLVAEDLAKQPQSPKVCLFHYTDDILLTSNSLAELEKAVPQVLSHLKSCGQAVNETKLQGPGLSVKFLGVVWSCKTKAILDAVIDKIQAYLTPTTVKQLQTFLGLLGHWRSFVPHLSQAVLPLHALVKKGANRDWTTTSEQAFQGAKLSYWSSYWSPLGVWLTWVALPAWKLDWSLYLGMAFFDCSSSENSWNPANKLGSVQSVTLGKVYCQVVLSISCFFSSSCFHSH